MTLTTQFEKPEITNAFDWQLSQEINVFNDQGEIIAKAEIEIITLNKHRGATQSYQLLETEETDWEIPLNLYFKGQNLSPVMCELLDVTANTKKAQSHIMLEALSVIPAYRKQGVAKFLLQEIANHYQKVQSITVMSMPMSLFVNADECEEPASKAYYQQLNLASDDISSPQLAEFFEHCNFIEYKVDAALLNEPLSYALFVSTPERILN